MLGKRKIDRLVRIEESERRFKETLQETPLEKGDMSAMIIAALITFSPALIIIIALLMGLWWLFT